jgi:hypothetical protein
MKDRILLDKTASWAMLLPMQVANEVFYICRLEQMFGRDDVEFLHLEHNLKSIRKEICGVCKCFKAYAQNYEQAIAKTNRSPSHFYDYVRELHEKKSKVDSDSGEFNIVTQMLACVTLIEQTWVPEEGSDLDRYQALLKGFDVFKKQAEQRELDRHAFFLKPCDLLSNDGHNCFSRTLLTSFYENYKAKLREDIDIYLGDIRDIIQRLVNLCLSKLRISDTFLLSDLASLTSNHYEEYDPIYKSYAEIIAGARFLHEQAKQADDDIVSVFLNWAAEEVGKARCFKLFEYITNAVADGTSGCLCHALTALSLALGTLTHWVEVSNNKDVMRLDAGIQGVFSFNSPLRFCDSMGNLSTGNSYKGVECRRSFRESTNRDIKIAWGEQVVITARAVDFCQHGIAVDSDSRIRDSSEDIFHIDEISTGSEPYFLLDRHGNKQRFRALRDNGTHFSPLSDVASVI